MSETAAYLQGLGVGVAFGAILVSSYASITQPAIVTIGVGLILGAYAMERMIP